MANAFNVGEIEVLVVSDGTISFPPEAYFPASKKEDWAAHERWLNHDGSLTFPFSSFVVRSGGKTLLIDAGIGDREIGPFKGGALMPELAAAGVDPSAIDAVFCTHLHLDHYGHVVRKDGDGLALNFPKASLHWTTAEHEFAAGAPGPDQADRQAMLKFVGERWQAREGGQTIIPGVQAVALPGHTPGHAGVVLSSGGQRAFILGDAISCPVQLTETEWSGLGDVDSKLARQSQETVAREFEDGQVLVGAAHFPGLQFGRVVVTEGRRYWTPVEK
jgi:glyoxylase-like metal-dependent hydrolase (beta-lactamase superfamily II)